MYTQNDLANDLEKNYPQGSTYLGFLNLRLKFISAMD